MNRANENPQPGGERIRRRILLPLGGTLLVFIAVFLFFAKGYLHNEMRRDLHNQQRLAEGFLAEIVEQRTGLLSSLLEQVAREPSLQRQMREGNRETLLAAAVDFVGPLKEQEVFSHLYFLSPEGEVRLRVHRPGHFGDRIRRRTFEQARNSGRLVSGIELGPLGTFTLRVVAPWYAEGRLLGYLEIGQDIGRLAGNLASFAQLHYLIVIRKPLLDRPRWEEGMKLLGREGDWERYPGLVISGRSLPAFSPELEYLLASGDIPAGKEIFLEEDGRFFHGVFTPLTDFGGRHVGDLLLVHDITGVQKDFRLAAGGIVLFCTLFGGGLMLTTSLGLGRLDRKLEQARRCLEEEVERTRAVNERLEQEVVERRAAESALEQARNELELRVSERTAELAGILRSVEDILFAVDARGKLVLMNTGAEEFLGRTWKEFRGHPVEEVIPDPVLLEHIRGALAQRRSTGAFDFLLPCTGGLKDRIMQARISVVAAQEGEFGGIIFLIKDVTDEREMDRLKSEFISTAAHELRTPMATILGYSELLLNFDTFSPKEQREFLSLIYEKADGISGLLDDLLDLSRLESGHHMKLRPAKISVGELLNPTVSHYEKFARNHRFQLELSDEDILLSADPGKIGQVMENLLSNAVKYSPKGGRVKISGRREGEGYLVSVSDEGVGMTPEQLRRAFEKFYRADTSDTAAHGTGLGLTIVKHIVEAHGGRVWAESRYGRGTAVHFELPALPGGARAKPAPERCPLGIAAT